MKRGNILKKNFSHYLALLMQNNFSKNKLAGNIKIANKLKQYQTILYLIFILNFYQNIRM